MKLYTVNGITLSSCGWAARVGISRQAMYSRVKKATTQKELEKELTSNNRQGFRSDKIKEEKLIPDNVVKLPANKK